MFGDDDTMENHTYLFKEETRLQMKGGAIGLKVTQALARLYNNLHAMVG